MTGRRRPAPPGRPARQGRLPQSVYWRRRLTLLLVVAVLGLGAFALAHHAGSSPHQAADVSQVTTPTVSTSVGPSPHHTTKPQVTRSTVASSSAPPATPSGPCDDSDVVVVPSVTVLEQSVSIRLAITTATTPACTWDLGPGTVQVAVKRAGAEVWNTATCPQAVPAQKMDVRQSSPAYATVVWGGRVGTDGCSVHNPPAALGTYKVQVAALGGQPASATFQLAAPVVTPPPSSTPTTKPSTGSKTGTAKKHSTKRTHHRHAKHGGSKPDTEPTTTATPTTTPSTKPSTKPKG